MRPRLLLTINCKFAVDFFARGLHTRTSVARLPLQALRQLGFLVAKYRMSLCNSAILTTFLSAIFLAFSAHFGSKISVPKNKHIQHV